MKNLEQGGHGVVFRAASEADVDWLVSLRIQTMDGYIRASGERLAQRDHLARVMQDFGAIRIITKHSKDVGMVKLVKAETGWQLVQLQLLSELQGCGIGGWVVSELIADACAADVALELSVLKVNPAKKLYERLGFVVVKDKEASFRMRYGG